jgi:N-acetylglucosamine kinase-like BadF-type ATPase
VEVQAQQTSILFCGLTCADWADEYTLLRDNVRALGLCNDVRIANDSIIALRGGTSAPYGAIVIAGTGGNCAIRSPKGDEFIYGFYQEDDLQGASAIGRRAMQAIYRSETGREPATILTARILALFGLASVDDLLRADVEDRLEWERVSRIAPLVTQAAFEGDAVAAAILCAFGKGLAELVIAGLTRFSMSGMDVEVVLSGSVFKGGSLIQEAMLAEFRAAPLKARLINARYEPVVGAALLGMESLGVNVGPEVARNVEQSSARLGLVRISE